MPGRPLISEREVEEAGAGFEGPEAACRRAVLRETIGAFEGAKPADHYHQLAAANLLRWRSATVVPEPSTAIRVESGDWGEVTRALSREFGVCFAVLNMANAYVPGGAYVEGATAQEENMFRRTDCHFTSDRTSMMKLAIAMSKR